jgi:hypothetical protein
MQREVEGRGGGHNVERRVVVRGRVGKVAVSIYGWVWCVVRAVTLVRLAPAFRLAFNNPSLMRSPAGAGV